MDQPIDAAQLTEAAIEALADGGFQLASPVDPPKKWTSHLSIGTTPFRAGVSGEVLIATTVGHAKEIAADLIGRDGSDNLTNDHGHSALAEVSEIVAAALLTAWVGADADWTLSPASGAEAMPGDYEDRRPSFAWVVTLETDAGQRLDVSISLTK